MEHKPRDRITRLGSTSGPIHRNSTSSRADLSQQIQRRIAFGTIPARNDMPLLLPGATLDTTFQYKNAILRQMIGKLVEKLLLLGLIMDGGQKENYVKLLVWNVPPRPLNELRTRHALPGFLEKAFVGVYANYACRSLAQCLASEEPFVAAENPKVPDFPASGLPDPRLPTLRLSSINALSFSWDLDAPDPSKSIATAAAAHAGGFELRASAVHPPSLVLACTVILPTSEWRLTCMRKPQLQAADQVGPCSMQRGSSTTR